jgi:hypothetical protein
VATGVIVGNVTGGTVAVAVGIEGVTGDASAAAERLGQPEQAVMVNNNRNRTADLLINSSPRGCDNDSGIDIDTRVPIAVSALQVGGPPVTTPTWA